MDRDSFPATLEEDVVGLRVEHTLRAKAKGGPFLRPCDVADEGLTGAHKGDSQVSSASVSGKLVQQASNGIWFAERVAAHNRHTTLDFEGKRRRSRLVEEEVITVIQNAHVCHATVVGREALDGSHGGMVFEGEDIALGKFRMKGFLALVRLVDWRLGGCRRDLERIAIVYTRGWRAVDSSQSATAATSRACTGRGREGGSEIAAQVVDERDRLKTVIVRLERCI